MTCRECGAEVDAQNVFCPQCGNRLEENVALESTSEPTAQQRFRKAATHRQAEGDEDREFDMWTGRFSGKAMVGTWIAASALTLSAIIAAVVFQLSGQGRTVLVGFISVCWLALIMYYLYQRYSVHYTLTNHRLIHERGILWRVVDRVELIDVGDITFKQGPVERILNVGTILIESSDHSDPNLLLPGIEDVREVAGIVDRQRREERKRRGLHIHRV